VDGLPYLQSGIICLVSLNLYILCFVFLKHLTLSVNESYDARGLGHFFIIFCNSLMT
jgi:hypothetical protein